MNSFHPATSTEGKAASPTACRRDFSGCFLKGSQVQTFFIFQNGARGTVAQNQDGQPVLAIRDVPGLPGAVDYFAAQVLDAAAANGEFLMSGGFHDDPVVRITVEEVQHLAAWIRRRVAQLGIGRFEAVFVPVDSSCPF